MDEQTPFALSKVFQRNFRKHGNFLAFFLVISEGSFFFGNLEKRIAALQIQFPMQRSGM